MQPVIEFLHFLTPYGLYSYLVMWGILVACGFGFPMPEDVILITGGILSAHGVTHLWVTIFVCMLGVMMGDGVVYFLGRSFGPRVKRSWLFRRIMTESVDARIARIFSKYGDKVVFMGRFMPGLRMPVFLSAGIYQVSPIKFFVLDGLAAIISVPLWIWVGYFFGNNLEQLEAKIKQFQFGIYGVLLGLILIGIAVVLFKKRLKANSTQ